MFIILEIFCSLVTIITNHFRPQIYPLFEADFRLSTKFYILENKLPYSIYLSHSSSWLAFFIELLYRRSNNNNQTVQSSICPLDYDSIEKWLQAIKMDRYLETFKQNGFMQPQDCLKLTRESLMDMGITLSGHQHKILSSVQTANSRLQREPSYKI